MKFDSFQCLSFDCYGTLIDWETGLLKALGPVLQGHGVSCPPDRLLAEFGQQETRVEGGPYRSYREVLETVLERMGDVLGFKASLTEKKQFAESIKTWPVFPDSSQALRLLGERYSLAILSNVDDDLFAASEKLLGVSFDHVLTAQQIQSYKPSRRNFEYLIDSVGVPKQAILHVAQSQFHDIGPAKAMGLATAWVDRRAGREGRGQRLLVMPKRISLFLLWRLWCPDSLLPELAGRTWTRSEISSK